ncbi:Adenylate cyclase 1 [Sulfitobacter sp. THAF37]|uniref:adenylate/guanylate cyclase domain-containing protein n=1 Tax=Sulfitobacter sp. THAF37 TaxID=2587855 RepID=UPI0012689B9E|nr:adenylate/guanylate cyclase domain-containing protein [Sulfitobacter sp. THAF37]QFT57431.1 Adenylate cyclase 1 [Sulfitobacter sp. THAF37]
MTAPVREAMEMTAALKDLTDWLIRQGLEDAPVEEWLIGWCDRLVAAGVPLQRVNLSMRAHHPEIGAVAFRWFRSGVNERFDYRRDGGASQEYRQSPLYYLLSGEFAELRQNLTVADPALDFPIFDDLRAQGCTEYYAVRRFFLRSDHDRPSDDEAHLEQGMTLSLATDAPGGFTDAQLDAVRSQLPPLCLTLKSNANRRMSEDITAAYLGQDASRRVLSGAIMRGSSETISAVVLYFDLRGFTKLSESLPGAAVIDLLNACFAKAVEVVEDNGGNVLKFMGDGMLAIFDLDALPDARRIAVATAMKLRTAFAEMNTARAAEGLTSTDFTLALHAGDVLYGNIGGKTRLDFTVIGPVVNTTARILGMTGPLDQSIVISSEVAAPLLDTTPELVSLGRYRLRGVAQRQELFTLD